MHYINKKQQGTFKHILDSTVTSVSTEQNWFQKLQNGLCNIQPVYQCHIHCIQKVLIDDSDPETVCCHELAHSIAFY